MQFENRSKREQTSTKNHSPTRLDDPDWNHINSPKKPLGRGASRAESLRDATGRYKKVTPQERQATWNAKNASLESSKSAKKDYVTMSASSKFIQILMTCPVLLCLAHGCRDLH